MARKPAQRDGLTYADSGVSIDEGDAFAGSIGALLRRTHGPRVIANDGGFAGLLRLDYDQRLFARNYKEPVLVACTDGVGTKVKLAADLKKFDTVGIDLVAMSVNDLIVEGAEPLLFLDYIAVPKVEQKMLYQIVKGVSAGCEGSGCALLGGETAEMAGVYSKGDFDLAGFAVGVVELRKRMDTKRVEPGDQIIGLASDGLHSNGFSLVRAVVDHAKLDLKKVYKDLDPERTLGDVLLTPTRLYARPVIRLLRSYSRKRPVAAMAHITGGGLGGNLERSLHDGVDAVINRKSWAVPPVFKFLKKHGKIAPSEMDRVFNMGVGYVMIVKPTFADAVEKKLRQSGETVFRLGKITKGKGRVRLSGS